MTLSSNNYQLFEQALAISLKIVGKKTEKMALTVLVQSIQLSLSADNKGLPFVPPVREYSSKPNVALVKASPNGSRQKKKDIECGTKKEEETNNQTPRR